MKRDQISRTQLMALLWAGVMAPAAQLLPGLLLPRAGRGAWLAVALAAPLVLAAGWMWGRLAGRDGPAGEICRLIGRGPGRVLLFIYMVWGELMLTVRLRACAQRLLASGNRDGALWFFVLALAALLLWMGRGKLAAFARAGQMFLAALLTAAGVVLALSWIQARPERLFPLWWNDAVPVLLAALEGTGVLGWGLFAAFLLGRVRPAKGTGWHWLAWGLGGTLLLAGAQMIILGNLGAELAARLDNPFFTLAKSVGVEGAFQRVESLVSALWTFADLAMGGVLIFALRILGDEVLPPAARRWVPWGAVILASVGSLTLLAGAAGVETWSRRWVPIGNLILGVAVPALLCLVDRAAGKGKKRGISCGPKAKKLADIEEEKKSDEK